MYNVQCKFRTQSLNPDPHWKERAEGKPGLGGRKERKVKWDPPSYPSPSLPFWLSEGGRPAMDAIKKKMQAMKVEKDNAMDRADVCEQAAKDAKVWSTLG